jgi:hypothetical protein
MHSDCPPQMAGILLSAATVGGLSGDPSSAPPGYSHSSAFPGFLFALIELDHGPLGLPSTKDAEADGLGTMDEQRPHWWPPIDVLVIIISLMVIGTWIWLMLLTRGP